MDQIKTALTILRRKQVQARTGMSCSALYLKMARGEFPRNVRIAGGRAVGWVEAEVNEWIERQIAQSRGAQLVPSAAREVSNTPPASAVGQPTPQGRKRRAPARSLAKQGSIAPFTSGALIAGEVPELPGDVLEAIWG